MQDSLGTWSVKASLTTVAASSRIAIQYSASSTNTAEVLYFKISQSGSTTSAMDSISLVRLTATTTGGTAGLVGTNIYDYTGSTTTGAGTFRGTLGASNTCINCTTGTGTITDVVHQMDFNVLAGYEWNAQPNMRVWVPVSGFIGVRCDALVALTYNVELVIRESK
jgi:hypothetical protein